MLLLQLLLFKHVESSSEHKELSILISVCVDGFYWVMKHSLCSDYETFKRSYLTPILLSMYLW